jgi:hypothetical protein
MTTTIKLTAAQAMMRWLSIQMTEDGERFIEGVWATLRPRQQHLRVRCGERATAPGWNPVNIKACKGPVRNASPSGGIRQRIPAPGAPALDTATRMANEADSRRSPLHIC